ncbi:MAG TPA: hypothetical protein VF743_12790, partial [Acidimicrobiales bacterium]
MTAAADGRTAMSNAQPSSEPTPTAPLRPGARVEVRNRFDGAWSCGFEIADPPTVDAGDGYRVRRVHDGSVLPGAFGRDQVRR